MEIKLVSGIATKQVKGKEANIDKIYASDSECNRIDWCKKAIVFIDDNGVRREISLQDIFDLVNA